MRAQHSGQHAHEALTRRQTDFCIRRAPHAGGAGQTHRDHPLSTDERLRGTEKPTKQVLPGNTQKLTVQAAIAHHKIAPQAHQERISEKGLSVQESHAHKDLEINRPVASSGQEAGTEAHHEVHEEVGQLPQ